MVALLVRHGFAGAQDEKSPRRGQPFYGGILREPRLRE
jgi:hypothetical protein